jgi:hypothetical protein
MLTTTQKTFIQKYWSQIALIIAIFLCMLQCNQNEGLQTANNTLDQDAKVHQKTAESYLALNDQLKSNALKYDDTIATIRKESRQKDLQITSLNKKVAERVEQVKAYKSIDIQGYVVDRYNLKPIDVPIVEKGVVFKDTVAILVVTDLVRYDGAKAELSITKEKLKDEQKINHQLELKNDNCEQQNQNSMLAISEKDKAFSLKEQEATKALNDLSTSRKNEKKESNKKNFWQITSGVLTVVATTLLIAN